jgi:hypothetical protein
VAVRGSEGDGSLIEREKCPVGRTSAASVETSAPALLDNAQDARLSRASGCEVVPMMQAVEARHRDNFGSDHCAFCSFSPCRSLLLQPEMGSVVMVVMKVFGHEPFQMAFIQHNHMVE